MLKIAIVADCPKSSSDIFHVGDEASAREVKRRIAQIGEAIEIAECDSSPLDTDLLRERVQLEMTSGCVDVSWLPACIQSAQVIWFAGAGNLNSEFPLYLYHYSRMMRACKQLGKIVIVSSQTIGPLTETDRAVLRWGSYLTDYWSVRDHRESVKELDKLGITCEIVPDDAWYLPWELRKREGGVNIGVCMRDWDSQTSVQCVRSVLECCSGSSYRIHLLPHLIDRDNGYDLAFMRRHFFGVIYDYSYLSHSNRGMDQEIKSLTASMDMIVTTRYHGAIFGVSTGVPTIAIYEGEYYRRKMEGIHGFCSRGFLSMEASQRVDCNRIVSLLSLVCEPCAPAASSIRATLTKAGIALTT
jgi:polysaccharide pyruvyl transferase WcaK-like protein